MALNEQKLINLGVYGYVTEYAAAREYYFDADAVSNPSKSNFAPYTGSGKYSFNSVGILRDNVIEYRLFWRRPHANYQSPWDPLNPNNVPYTQELKGIQIMPLTPSMMYLGYDTAYALESYNQLSQEHNVTGTAYKSINNPNWWKSILLRFKAMFNNTPDAVVNEFETSSFPSEDDGSSLSFSYHFIHFFNSLGHVDTEYYADYPAFLVMKKGTDDRTYIAYNPDKTQIKTINFYKRGVLIPVGTMKVPPSTMFSTKDFLSFKNDSGYFAEYISGDASWNVVMTAPFSAFSQDPQIVITSAAAPALLPSDYDYAGQCFNISVSAPFQANASLTLDYSGVTIPAGINQNDLRLAYVSPSGQLEIIKNAPQGKTISVNINKAGTYILVRSVQPLVWAVYAYPNPYKASRHGSSGITFANTQAGDRIRIYTIAGEKVFDKAVISDDFKWDIVNDYGNRIASGIYIYYIESQGKVYKGKIALER